MSKKQENFESLIPGDERGKDIEDTFTHQKISDISADLKKLLPFVMSLSMAFGACNVETENDSVYSVGGNNDGSRSFSVVSESSEWVKVYCEDELLEKAPRGVTISHIPYCSGYQLRIVTSGDTDISAFEEDENGNPTETCVELIFDDDPFVGEDNDSTPQELNTKYHEPNDPDDLNVVFVTIP